MSERFDQSIIRSFIDSANRNADQVDHNELNKIGFRFHEGILHRTWLTGTEVYAMAYHVTKRVQKTDWNDFTVTAGLQSTSFLSKAYIPANTTEKATRIKDSKSVSTSFYYTPCDYMGLLFNTSSNTSRYMDILDCVISVWENETSEFLSHTNKEADRFMFASLFPIDPLIAPMAEYILFGEHLKLRYKEAEADDDKKLMNQCLSSARERTVKLFRDLSSTTKKPYVLPSTRLLDSAAASYDANDVERSILKDADYRSAIEAYIKSGVRSYSYYSAYQLDTHGPGCPSETGLVAYFLMKAREWLQLKQGETGPDAETVIKPSIDARYFQSISGWKNAIIDRKVDAGDSDVYETEKADSYSNRYVSQGMQTLDGERFCLFEDFLLEESRKSLLIASDSGSGKTTIVRGISALVAQAHLCEEERDSDFIDSFIPDTVNKTECLEILSKFIPVIISQPSFAEVERYRETYSSITGIAENDVFLRALYSLLPRGKNGFVSIDEFMRAMSLGRELLFIVDSVDEVPAPRIGYIDQLAKLVKECEFGKVLITTRNLANRENAKLRAINNSLSPDSPVVEILPLDEQRQEALLRKVATRDVSLNDLRCFPGASDILGNPLVLVAMVRYHNDCENDHMLVDEALRSTKTMLASLGSLPTGEAVNEKIREVAFLSLANDNHITLEQFSKIMKRAIKESNTVAENDDSFADSLLQGVLWRSGMFKINKGGRHDLIDFRYKALKGWWASEYIYRQFDEDLSSRSEKLPSRFANTIACFRSLMEGATRMDEATRFATLCSMEKIAPNGSNDFLIVEDDEDDLRRWVVKAVSERIFLYSAYPESSRADRDFAEAIYDDASSFGFAEGIEGFCLKN